MAKYKVIKESGHECCFDASVIDSTKTEDDDDYVICESWDVEMAEKICKALNEAEKK